MPAVPATHPVAGTPAIRLYYVNLPPRIGLSVSLPAPVRLPVPIYHEIEVTLQSGPKGYALSVSTSNELLFRPFFSVLLEIADAIQLEGCSPVAAVMVAIERFANVIQRNSELSPERLVGLWGELWVLDRLLKSKTTAAIENWTGWRADQHDFRIGALELEVKTTMCAAPVHVINGSHQLLGSQGYTLFLVSLQLMRSDKGDSLKDRVETIAQTLAGDQTATKVFERACAKLGVTENRLAMTQDQFALRRGPVLVPVDGSVPRLTPDVLLPLLGQETFVRLGELHYSVDLTGLGFDDLSDTFRNFVPWMTSRDN